MQLCIVIHMFTHCVRSMLTWLFFDATLSFLAKNIPEKIAVCKYLRTVMYVMIFAKFGAKSLSPDES